MPHLLYFLTSFLYIISFPNFNIPWAAWICLIPLVIAVDKEKCVFSVVRNCFFCGWSIFLGSMYWLTYVTWAGYILVTIYLALYIVLFGVIRFYNKNFIFLPIAWTALEFIRSNLLGGIPWLLLGASQYKLLPLIQISNITGVYGVSFLVALVNIGIVRRRFFCILVLVLVIGYGEYNLKKIMPGQKMNPSITPRLKSRGINKGHTEPPPIIRAINGAALRRECIKIGIVQPNVPQEIKWDPACTDLMLDKLEVLTKQIRNADLVVWPETAVLTLTETPGLLGRIKDLKKNILLGSQGIDEKRNYYNSAFLISEEGNVLGEYRKIHLVPFGEFVPFENIFPFLKMFTPIEEGFSKGSEYAILRIGAPVQSTGRCGLRIAALICFEDIFPNLAREFVKRGAEMLVNITNDGWFGETNAVYQHAYLSVFRAVENGVPLVRATNTGLSCFIESTGKIHIIKPFIETSEAREILVTKRNTFYTRYGDVFCWLCVIVLCAGGFYAGRIKK